MLSLQYTEFHLVKLLMITTCCFLLLSLLCVGCHGDSSENCTALFKENTYSTADQCYMQLAPSVVYGHAIELTVNATGTNLTYLWWKDGNTTHIHNTTEFTLEDNNKTLKWSSAGEGNIIFFVNVTNECGITETGCFHIHSNCPLCNQIDNCPSVVVTNDTWKNSYEHSDIKLYCSITAQVEASILKWCFVGANNKSSCCICDNNQLDIPGAGNCTNKDWKLTSHYGEGCSNKYGCSLTVNNISRKYDGGTFISNSDIIGLSEKFDKNFTFVHINIISNSSSKETHGFNKIYFEVAGCGIFVGIVAIVAVVCVVSVVKKRSVKTKFWSGRYSGYEEIQSPVAANNMDDDVSSRDFDNSTGDNRDDVSYRNFHNFAADNRDHDVTSRDFDYRNSQGDSSSVRNV